MAYTYAGHYVEALIDTEGDALASVPVKVYVAGTSTLATLYTSRPRATTASNPATTSSSGNLRVYLDPGAYELRVVLSGVEQDRKPMPVFANPAEVDAKVDAHAALTTGAHGGLVAATDPRITDTRT